MATPRTLVLLATAVAVATSACTSPKDPGVRMESASADIVFGVELPESDQVSVSPVAVPVTSDGVPVVEQTSASLTTLQVPFRNKIPSRFRDVAATISPEQAAAAACPAAPIGAAPPAQAPLTASRPPKPGVYRFKISGTRTFRYTSGAVVSVPVQGFQPRVIRNVTSTSETRWTYEAVQPDGNGNVLVTTWSVNAKPTEKSQAAPYVGENAVRASEPDAGVSVMKIEKFDATGSSARPFQPATPVTYLPLPVAIGLEFQSVGVDPRTGATQAVEGQPVQRQTVDACGTLADGWRVDLEITEASGIAPQEQRKEEDIVSTDLGGLVISQRVVQTGTAADGTVVESDITFSLGQVEPSPLPQGAA